VEIEAFSPEGNLVLGLLFSGYEWYEQQHPIVDDPEERVRRNVAEIRGKQYDSAGALSQHWRCAYAADGSLIESWQWQADGALQHRKWHPDGRVEEVDP
jgi:hypothetical protein